MWPLVLVRLHYYIRGSGFSAYGNEWKGSFIEKIYAVVLAGFWFRWCFVLYVFALFLGLKETKACHFQPRGSLRVGVLKPKQEAVREG